VEWNGTLSTGTIRTRYRSGNSPSENKSRESAGQVTGILYKASVVPGVKWIERGGGFPREILSKAGRYQQGRANKRNSYGSPAIITSMKIVVSLLLLIALTAAIIGCTQPASSGASPAPVQTTVTTPEATPTTEVQTSAPTPAPTEEVTTAPTLSSIFPESSGMKNIQTIVGVGDETVTNVSIPSSYWELWYTADPLTTGGQDVQSPSGSYSAVFPSLTIKIVDHDSGKVIDTIQPPGGLDTALWQKNGDPRPWSQKYYSGNAVYDFDISAQNLRLYTIEIHVPS